MPPYDISVRQTDKDIYSKDAHRLEDYHKKFQPFILNSSSDNDIFSYERTDTHLKLQSSSAVK